MVALELPVLFPLLAVKLATVAAAATVTDAGTLSKEFVLARATVAPPAGADRERLIMQVLDVFGPMLVGLQLREETCTSGVRPMVVFAELPLYAAVIVATELLVTVTVLRLNVPMVANGAMVTDPGIVIVVLLFASAMLAPLMGAPCDRVTVQMLEEFEPRLFGLQDKVDSDAGGIKVTFVLVELPP
jgi:hypothetical protein